MPKVKYDINKPASEQPTPKRSEVWTAEQEEYVDSLYGMVYEPHRTYYTNALRAFCLMHNLEPAPGRRYGCHYYLTLNDKHDCVEVADRTGEICDGWLPGTKGVWLRRVETGELVYLTQHYYEHWSAPSGTDTDWLDERCEESVLIWHHLGLAPYGAGTVAILIESEK